MNTTHTDNITRPEMVAVDTELARLYQIAHTITAAQQRAMGFALKNDLPAKLARTLAKLAALEADPSVGEDDPEMIVARASVRRWEREIDDAEDAHYRYQARIDDTAAKAAPLEAIYAQHRWTRFFGVPRGHIHAGMNCHSCNKGASLTRFGWMVDMAGLGAAAAVDAYGPALCSHCFPNAPVKHQQKAKLKKSQLDVKDRWQ